MSELTRFTEKAQGVAAIVTEAANSEQAVDAALDLIIKTRNGEKTTLAIPGLPATLTEKITARCQENGIDCISEGLRQYPQGVDFGISICDYGIAETGTLVYNCPDEDARLASMISDYHICLLAKKNIHEKSLAIVDKMEGFMKPGPDYTAFITGPSRTADIERVLTIGAHGPLDLHIFLVEEN